MVNLAGALYALIAFGAFLGAGLTREPRARTLFLVLGCLAGAVSVRFAVRALR